MNREKKILLTGLGVLFSTLVTVAGYRLRQDLNYQMPEPREVPLSVVERARAAAAGDGTAVGNTPSHASLAAQLDRARAVQAQPVVKSHEPAATYRESGRDVEPVSAPLVEAAPALGDRYAPITPTAVLTKIPDAAGLAAKADDDIPPASSLPTLESSEPLQPGEPRRLPALKIRTGAAAPRPIATADRSVAADPFQGAAASMTQSTPVIVEPMLLPVQAEATSALPSDSSAAVPQPFATQIPAASPIGSASNSGESYAPIAVAEHVDDRYAPPKLPPVVASQPSVYAPPPLPVQSPPLPASLPTGPQPHNNHSQPHAALPVINNSTAPSPAHPGYEHQTLPHPTNSNQPHDVRNHSTVQEAAAPAHGTHGFGLFQHQEHPATAPAQDHGAGVRQHHIGQEAFTVRPNDSFWTISQTVYGSGSYFRALEEHNRERIPYSERLRVGDVVAAPPVKVLEERYPDLCPKPRNLPPARTTMTPASARGGVARGRVYRVRQGDTLFDIARNELGKAARWHEVYDLNRDVLGDDFDFLAPGTELVLPDPRTGNATDREPLTTQSRSPTQR